MEEVRERRPHAAEQQRQAHRHTQRLAAGVEPDRLDPRRDELWPARHGREREPVGDGRQLAQEPEHVALVAGALAAEDVGVDDDARVAHNSASR